MVDPVVSELRRTEPGRLDEALGLWGLHRELSPGSRVTDQV